MHLKVELDSNSVAEQEHMITAEKFGIPLRSRDVPIEAKEYVLTFIQKAFFPKRKTSHGTSDRVSSVWHRQFVARSNSHIREF